MKVLNYGYSSPKSRKWLTELFCYYTGILGTQKFLITNNIEKG